MKKSDKMVVNNAKIYQKTKNKSSLSIEKIIIKWEKTPYQHYKKLFAFRKFIFFLGLGWVSGLYEMCGKHEKLFPFGEKLFLQEIRVQFFILAWVWKICWAYEISSHPGLWEIFSIYSKSPVILEYIFFYYFMLNQQPSWSLKSYKKFYTWSPSALKYKKHFSVKI